MIRDASNLNQSASPTATPQTLKNETPEPAAQAQHSPLPWHVGKAYHTSNLAVLCQHNEMIAMIYSLANHECTEGKEQATVDFIVRACNSFPHAERLAEALRDARNKVVTQECQDMIDKALADWSAQ